MTINFEQDRVESVTQIDAAKTLSDKVIELINNQTKFDSLVSGYKEQIKLFDPVDMAANVLKVYKAAGF